MTERLQLIVVSDDDVVLLFEAEMLRNFDCDRALGVDEEAVLERFHARQFDVMFLDVGRPMTNGVEVDERFKHNDAGTLLVVMTGTAEEEFRGGRDLLVGVLLKLFFRLDLTNKTRTLLAA